ncbi:MAG: ribosomal-processing cysteine protease Prp [Thermotogaceae bacterium]|nr:ribosomal-processing cysteine protease Prp [Thermotogaceae bacterium]
MIKVRFCENEIIIEGHADFDEYGKDIVCAAVSSMVQYAAYVLKTNGAELEKREGFLKIFNIKNDNCSKKMIFVLKEALMNIEEKFPEHLKLEVK